MLRLARVDVALNESPRHGDWIREVGALTAGVVAIDVALDKSALPSLHWRAGNWTKPPLDVAVDPEDGRLRGIQIVLQDEGVPDGKYRVNALEVRRGVPAFDVGTWANSDRYVDETIPVVATRAPDDSLEVLIGEYGEPGVTLTVDDQLELLFTSESVLSAIRVGPLSAEEWSLIAAADTGSPAER